MANKPVTLAGLRKDLSDLYAQVIVLNDSFVALRKQVQRMAERVDLCPTPNPERNKEIVKLIKLFDGLSLTPSSPSPKTRMDKGQKGNKNNK